MTAAVTTAQLGAPGVSLGFKNRIINGGMTIDQRNAGASVTPTTDGTYTLDRWVARLSAASKFSVQQLSSAPAGFVNSLGVTSLAATSVGSGDYYSIMQRIEGLNTLDLAWGSQNAKTVTLSFQVYSSLTGTFGGSVANNGFSRSYPFSYTVASPNTWASVSVTIPGDTSGTWLTTTGIGLQVSFGLGVGTTYSAAAGSWGSGTVFSASSAVQVVATNGATFYITDVQLEVGSAATQFEFRDYGRELMMCQRYYQRIGAGSSDYVTAFGCVKNTTNQAYVGYQSIVSFRAAPSVSFTGTGLIVGGNSAISSGSIVSVTANSQTPVNGVTFTQTATAIPNGYNFGVYVGGNSYYEFAAEL